jgi:hypothetical protein
MNNIKLEMNDGTTETTISLYKGSQCLKKVEELERGIVNCLIEKLPFHFIDSGGSLIIPYETLTKQTTIKIYIG